MGTVALLAGGAIASSAFGAREARKAGQTQAGAAERAAQIRGEAFREAGGIEAAGLRQFGDVETEAGRIGAAGLERFAGVEREAGDIRAGGFREAAGRFDPFAVGGAEAAQKEAALSGALGPEAQQLAIDQQVESPFTKFIEQRGRQQLGQGFAATGGLGGGARQRALTEFGQGVATQSLGQQLQNLRNVRQQGFGATSNIAELIASASGAQAGGVRGAGVAQLGAQDALSQAVRGRGQALLGAEQALATGVRGVGGAEAAGVQQAGQATANARINRAGQIQQGIGGLTNIFALGQQGLLDRPQQFGGFKGPTTNTLTRPNQLLIEPV